MAYELFHQTDFTDAKRRLSGLMDDVVHQHRPVQVNRHRGREQMVMIGQRDILDMLESAGQRFVTQVTFDDDEMIVSLPAFGLIGSGPSLEAAADDLVEVLREYCAQYLQRLELYRQTDRRTLLPLVFLFALTPEDAQRDLLLQPPVAAA